jgi:hypothetical protein
MSDNNDNIDGFSSADSDSENPPDLETSNSTQTLQQFENLLIQVKSLKESGNMSFKNKEFETSVTYYSEALGSHGKLEFGKDLPKEKRVEAKQLLISLHGNLSAVYTMTEKWNKVIDHSTKGLDEVSTIDVAMERKLLTRRGIAKSRKNTLRGAKEDLERASKLIHAECSNIDEPSHKKLKKERKKIVKEMKSVMTRLKERLKGRKKNLKKMFSDGLYQDRKNEAERKKQAKAKRELELRMKYETSPMAKHQTFEEFKKEEIEREKKIKEENERKEKERQERRRKEIAERRKREREMENQRAQDDDLSSDEELKGLMKGYKSRKDGTKTTYFDRELDPEAKRLLAQQSGPKRILSTPTDTKNNNKKNKKKRVKSEWNSGATWEERDVSDLAQDLMSRVLCDVKYKGANGEATVTDVDSVSGDASVCLIRGRERAVFDLKVRLSFSGTNAQGQHVSGVLASEECSSLCDSETKSTQGFKLVSGASRDSVTMKLVDSLSRRIASVIESEFSARLIE